MTIIGWKRTYQTTQYIMYLALLLALWTARVWAQSEAAVPEQSMSLWEMVKAGGVVMVFLGILSLGALFLGVYFLVKLRRRRVIDRSMLTEVVTLLEQGDKAAVEQRCRRQPGILSSIILAGLDKQPLGYQRIVEAMSEEGDRQATILKQKLRYLADIGVISPMLGLLGTVLGLMAAFNVIAFDVELVKPIMLAGAVSKALVTTAAGLIVGILSMAFYFYFRGALLRLFITIEESTHDLAEQMRR